MDEDKSEKPKKPVKVKNPCKICATSVNQKTGLQCKGACKKWMHFTCLKYTPGKIQDIKDGFIKIICPCPDCQGSGPKEEIISKPPYRCAKSCCPTAEAPTCDSLECPINKTKSPPACSNVLNEPGLQNQAKAHPPLVGIPMGMPMNNLPWQPNQLGSGQTCQPRQPNAQSKPQYVNSQYPGQQMQPQTFGNQEYQPMPPIVQQPSPFPVNLQQPNTLPQQPCCINQQQPNMMLSQPYPNNLQQPNTPQQPAIQGMPQTTPPASKKTLGTQDQATGPAYATPAKQSKSCSCMSNDTRRKENCGDKNNVIDRRNSDTNVKKGSLYDNLEEMSKTVGQLTNQIKELMCKLVNRS